MKTTLNAIREHSPCTTGWSKLLKNIGKTKADDEPLAITTILESNGLEDALWCLRAIDGHEKEIRLFANLCEVEPKVIEELDEADYSNLQKVYLGFFNSEEMSSAQSSSSQK
jgi:hypothetical protein